MDLITREEIDQLFETLEPQLDLSTIINVEDNELTKVLNYYLFLKQYTREIMTLSLFTFERVLYSQYYWFITFKNQYFLEFGYDGGMEQQAQGVIENLMNELNGEVDWELLEKIEKKLRIDC